jgi:hypothetical protein
LIFGDQDRIWLLAFEFRFPANRVSDSVFPGDRHLNRMDKFTSHVIQMDSNSRSLNSRVSDARALDSEVSDSIVSEASDTKGLGHESRTPRIRVLGLGGSRLGKGSWRLEA